jgi:hypothetical protein
MYIVFTENERTNEAKKLRYHTTKKWMNLFISWPWLKPPFIRKRLIAKEREKMLP